MRARIAFAVAAASCALLLPNVAAAGPAISVSPTSLTFGDRCVGAPGAASEIAVGNTGDQPLTISSISVVGANPSDFTLTGAQPRTLAPGETLRFKVAFVAVATGDRSGIVRIASNAPSSPNDVPVSGTGVTRVLEVTPDRLAFGELRAGSASDDLVLQLASVGSAAVTINAVTVSGEHKADFTARIPASKTLDPGEDAIVPVTFRPRSSGARRAAVTIDSNACAGRTTIAVTGTGTSPKLTVRPSPVSFGSVAVGESGSPVAVVVFNAGRAPVRITDISVEGAHAQDFRFEAFPELPRTLGPGEEFPVNATFVPGLAGPRRALLRLSTDSGATLTVELTGNIDGAALPTASATPSPSPSESPGPLAAGRKRSRPSGGIGDYAAVAAVVLVVAGIFAALLIIGRRKSFQE